MDPHRVKLGLCGSVLALLAVLILLVCRPRIAPASRGFTASGEHAQMAGSAPGTGGPGGAGVRVEEQSRLADRLNSPGGDVHSDLRMINEIFIAYRGAVRAENPVGENTEITAALTGRNRLGYAFIPGGCPAIDAQGRLCDRWGTPYFFHQLSGDRMEVRSAGPDRRLWTGDDEVLTP